jgi:hypothetical protein
VAQSKSYNWWQKKTSSFQCYADIASPPGAPAEPPNPAASSPPPPPLRRAVALPPGHLAIHEFAITAPITRATNGAFWVFGSHLRLGLCAFLDEISSSAPRTPNWTTTFATCFNALLLLPPDVPPRWDACPPGRRWAGVHHCRSHGEALPPDRLARDGMEQATGAGARGGGRGMYVEICQKEGGGGERRVRASWSWKF